MTYSFPQPKCTAQPMTARGSLQTAACGLGLGLVWQDSDLRPNSIFNHAEIRT
jgi:hypothetical protein